MGRINGTREFGIACLQAALGKGGFLGLALQRALLLSALRQFALAFNHPFVQLGVTFLAVGQLHIQGLKLPLRRDASLLQILQLGVHLGQVGFDLRAAGPGLLQQLR